MATRSSTPRPMLTLADEGDREAIYRLRHEVYAAELGQHSMNRDRRLTDALDGRNDYIIATVAGHLAGCVSITRRGTRPLAIEKYIDAEELPVTRDARLREIRLLTVAPAFRNGPLAAALMYAALRWVEEGGASHVIAMGRREVLGLYVKLGLQPTGRPIRSGRVDYEMLHATVDSLRRSALHHRRTLIRLERCIDWRLPMPFHRPINCYHGGAFFKAIGEDLTHLERKDDVINADVLDAWFSPAPAVIEALRRDLPWLARTSPPTNGEGLIDTIADVRGLDPASILPGAGSSDLIFRVLREWLTPASRVLLLDPTYGEYAHVLEHVIGCHIERFTLSRDDGYGVDPGRLLEAIRRGRHDLVILVNPNSPTGRHLPRERLERLLADVPPRTRVWIDETYIDYVGGVESLERFAVARENVVVCKSMSKAYALSGMRVAYLCGPARLIEPLRAITPPWVVGLPSQLAAITAMKSAAYYEIQYRRTHALRESLAADLAALGVDVVPHAVANFLLCHLDPDGPDAATVIARCRESNVFMRDVSTMGSSLGEHALRTAVKDERANARIVAALRAALSRTSTSPAFQSSSTSSHPQPRSASVPAFHQMSRVPGSRRTRCTPLPGRPVS